MKKLTFQIIDHGCDGEQYFPGCGVAFSEFQACTTGIGDSAHEAADDALSQFHMSIDSADLSTEDAALLAAACEEMDKKEDTDKDDPETSPEWHHYVSIRWRFE